MYIRILLDLASWNKFKIFSYTYFKSGVMESKYYSNIIR